MGINKQRQEFMNQIWKRILKTNEEIKKMKDVVDTANAESEKLENLGLIDKLEEFDKTICKDILRKCEFISLKQTGNFSLLLSNVPDEVIKNN